MAILSSSRVAQRRRSSTFFYSRLKRLSMAALSPAAPTRPMEPTMSWRPRAWTNFRLRNWLPRSLCRMQPATSPRRATALLSAVVANRNFIRESIE
jgi:hypothetical protein